MNDRRRSPRSIPELADAVTIGGNRPAKVVNVSLEGAHLELASALNPRGECRIAIASPGGLIQVRARVVHCRLTGFASPGAASRPVFHAGVEFVDIEPETAASILRSFVPPPAPRIRTGPIKIKVDVDALERMAHSGKHGAN